MLKISEVFKNLIQNLNEMSSNFFKKFYQKHPLSVLLLLLFVIVVSIKFNNLHAASIYFGLLILLSSFYLFFRKELKNDNFSDIDNLERILRSTGVLSIIFLSITYILINFAKYLIPNVLHIGSIDAWIQFAGSILGGSLTLFALAITLNEQENIRKKEFDQRELNKKKDEHLRIEQLEYRNPPILKLCLNDITEVENRNTFIKRIHINSFTKSHFKLDLSFELKNISTASIANISLLNLEVFVYDPFKHGLLNEDYISKLESAIDINQISEQINEYELLPSNTSIYLDLSYNLNQDLIALIDEFPSKFVNTKLKIKYSSTLLKNEYIVESTLNFSIMCIGTDYYSIRYEEPKNFYRLPKFNI